MRSWFFTSESVTEGHPDKVADAVSDAVLDAAVAAEPAARVACETFVTAGLVLVGGEASPHHELDIDRIVRDTVRRIGYDGFDPGFSADGVEVMSRLHEQSPDISDAVLREIEGAELGAGDQGMMFGFAVDETEELMPLPIQLAHRLAERLAEVRRTGKVDYLRPDGKTQVTIRYEGNAPVEVRKVLISAHHAPGMEASTMAADVRALVVDEVVPSELAERLEFVFNPSGRFEMGGPVADTGLTGRKIIVDTYGGYARHGGGAFSGKDATKVDRSAAYAARWAAKNLVAAGLATKLEIQLSYAIGVADPFSIHVETFGTEQVSPQRIQTAVTEVFDFRPAAIVSQLGLRSPVFSATSAYGHFGRPGFAWERLDRVDEIRAAAGL